MKRYLLSIEQPDGPPPKSVDLEQIRNDINALEKEMKDAGVWVFNDHFGPPTEGHGAAARRRRGVRKGRSVPEGEGACRRAPDHQGARQGLGARVGTEARARDDPADRGA
jgi:hypothetical protein